MRDGMGIVFCEDTINSLYNQNAEFKINNRHTMRAVYFSCDARDLARSISIDNGDRTCREAYKVPPNT